jgi:hypothetical protein
MMRKGDEEIVTIEDQGEGIDRDELAERRQRRGGGISRMEDASQGGEYVGDEPRPSRDVSELRSAPQDRDSQDRDSQDRDET